jgi:heparan-alpha-glucosaminide N-acetyltransferase
MSAHAPAQINSVTNNVLTTQRIFSIDALRGITILVMIFVNELAGVSGLPAWTKHAGANDDTMTYVDVVFPAFLFIVGMSIPFAIASRVKKGDSILKICGHILFRTAGLIVLGVFMVNAEGGYNEQAMKISLPLWSLLFYICVILVWNSYPDLNRKAALAIRVAGVLGLIILAILYRGGDGSSGMTPQWWGILGLIGWAYFFACVFYLATKGSLPALLVITIICFLFFLIGKENEASSNAFLQFMSAQKGHATHTGIVLCGLIVSLLIFDEQKSIALKSRMLHVSLFAAIALVAGFLLRPGYEISKIHATPTWALFSVVSCIAIFILLYWLIDIEGKSRWTRFIQPAASNPLLTYIIPFIVIALMGIFHLERPEIFSSGISGVIWSALYAFAVMALVIFLNRMRIKLQL